MSQVITIGTPSQNKAVATLVEAGWTKTGRASRIRSREGQTSRPVRVPMTDPTGAERRVWIGRNGKIVA